MTQGRERVFACMCVQISVEASVHTYVCLSDVLCVSSTLYVLMSHRQRVLPVLTKIRVLVICSVNCSALLIIQDLEKG